MNDLNNKKEIKILLVEDDEEDYMITRDLLGDIPNNQYRLEWVKTYKDALDAMVDNSYDVYLVDYYLREDTGNALVKEAIEKGLKAPVIFLTGLSNAESDQKALLAGASDYLEKNKLDSYSLERSIRYSIERKKNEIKIKLANESLEKKVQERTKELEEINNKLQESVNEKEILLREIHHRVKNNLQVISSLISLQSSTSSDEVVTRMFQNTQSRIKTIALIHEKLYQSTSLDKVNFTSYVRTLTSNLLYAFGTDLDRINISFDCKEDIFLPIDIAIPCGLIMNEVVTNSLKYAFPNGNKGKININFKNTGNEYFISITDNGIGIPEDLDISKLKSLGMQLINILSQQISAKMEFKNNNGTYFSISFVA